jgi:phosphatidylglycerol:prolipoprotein diacylglycerol transferase
MNPVLFRIGPLPISSFGLLLLVAFWVGIAMTRRRSPAVGVESGAMLDLALYMIIAGIICGRIGYVLVNFGTFAQDWRAALAIWRDGGLTFYGALAGGVWVAWLYTRPRGLSTAGLLDAAAPGLAVGYGVGMIGALLHSTPQNPLIMGKPTGVPWAVQVGFERVHPTQIYLLLAAVAIYLVLRAQREVPRGGPFLTFLLLQGVSRFVVEFFVQSPLVLGPLTKAQVASGIVAILALAGLVVAARRHQRAIQPPAEGTGQAVPPPLPPSSPP